MDNEDQEPQEEPSETTQEETMFNTGQLLSHLLNALGQFSHHTNAYRESVDMWEYSLFLTRLSEAEFWLAQALATWFQQTPPEEQITPVEEPQVQS